MPLERSSAGVLTKLQIGMYCSATLFEYHAIALPCFCLPQEPNISTGDVNKKEVMFNNFDKISSSYLVRNYTELT
jgi:hypothetical protein